MSTLRVDFLAPAKPRWVSWGMLAFGCAAMVVALWLDRQWSQQRAQQEAATAARVAELERRRQEAERPIAPSAEQRRLERVAPQLRQPWLPVLRAIEGASRPPVHLLALSIDPTAGTVRVEGEAPSFEAAMAYSRSLDVPGVLGPAQLRSHDQVADDGGRAVVRFAVVAPWSAK